MSLLAPGLSARIKGFPNRKPLQLLPFYPALVAPEWEGFWRDAFHVLPFWSGGKFFDVIQNKTWTATPAATSGSLELIAKSRGLALDWTDSSLTNDEHLTIDKRHLGLLMAKSTWTFFYETTTTSQRAFAGIFNTGLTTGLQILINSNSIGDLDAGKLHVFLRDEDSSLLRSGFTSDNANLNTGNPTLLTVVIDKAKGSSDGIICYLNGIKVPLTYGTSGTGVNFVDFEFDLAIGTRNNRSTFDLPWFGRFYYATVHTAIFSEAEAKHLASDPFGPFRTRSLPLFLPSVVTDTFDTALLGSSSPRWDRKMRVY